MFYRVMLRSAR